MEKAYYVYVLFRENGIPFYVGMGKGDRWASHEKRAHFRRTHKDRLIAAMQERAIEVPKVKVREGLTKREAFEVEVALIAAIGREPSGTLINQTSGGDGVPGLSAEVRRQMGEKARERLKGVNRPAEVIARITATKRAKAAADRAAKEATLKSPQPKKPKQPYRHSEDARRRIGEAAKGRPQTAEKSRKISEALRGRRLSEEHRAKISAIQTGRKEDPIHSAWRGDLIRQAHMARPAEERSETTRRGWETRRAKRHENSKSLG